MKVTSIRKDKNSQLHVKTMTFERLLEYIRDDRREALVGGLRRQLPVMQGFGGVYEKMHQLPRVYPAVELQRDDESDEVRYGKWNGVVLLTVTQLQGEQACAEAKRQAAVLPMTLAAMTGSSGRTVKVLVRIAPADGYEPQNEEAAQRLYAAGYETAFRLYDAVMPGSLRREAPSLRASFRMTFDSEPYYRANASTLSVSPLAEGAVTAEASVPVVPAAEQAPAVQRSVDMDKYDDYEFQYARVVGEVRALMDERVSRDDPQWSDLFVTEVANRLRAIGFPQEECVLHLRSHLWSRQEDEHLRSIVAAVYAEKLTKPAKEDAALRIRRSQKEMMHFLESRYVFRYNTIMGYTEYRSNNTYLYDYQPVDERVANRMAIECRLAGLDTWDKDVSRYLHSSYVPAYNPVWEYLDRCSGQWDGRDRIRELARTVPTDNPHWPEWFYRWFLGMVAQWRSGVHARYGNQTAPLLISQQGYNKSTFCQSLIPPELQWGYTGNMLFSDKKQVLQQMAQMLLVNLDEFNQISPQLQQGFLKNVITLSSVQVKRPYGKHVEQMARMASFIATTNQTDVLSDPSGARRFLGVELTGPIDVSRRLNHVQLYAQALEALRREERSWFDEEETRQIMESNRRFRQQSSAEQFFYEYFEPAADEQHGTYLTTAAIFDHLRKHVSGGVYLGNVNQLGRILTAVKGLKRRRTMRGTEYLVTLKKHKSCYL